MKKYLFLLLLAAAFVACNEPSGDGAGNDTGDDVHNNAADTASTTTGGSDTTSY